MITFIRIVLFLMLKGGLAGGDGKSSGTGASAAVWDSMFTMPGILFIEGDQNTIEEAIHICTLYNPTEINRVADDPNAPIPLVRASMRFDAMKPGLQKQVSERLMQQFVGRIRLNWTNTL